MAAQWPLIRAGLVALLPTLPGWVGVVDKVYAGRCLTGSPPPNYATVGFTGADQTGNYRTDQSPDGYGQIETGSIASELSISTGSDGAEGAAITDGKIQAALDGLAEAQQADRRLGGLLSPDGTSSFMVTLAPLANSQGTASIARFTLDYYTVTYS